MTWSRRFDDPVAAGGKMLRTLQDAADYILKLSKQQQARPHWQTAVKTLINAAEGRDFVMHARIAMMQALNHGKPSPSSSPRAKKPAKIYRILR